MLTKDQEMRIAINVSRVIKPDDRTALPVNLITHAVSLLIADAGYAATCNHLRDMSDAIEKIGMELEFNENGN